MPGVGSEVSHPAQWAVCFPGQRFVRGIYGSARHVRTLGAIEGLQLVRQEKKSFSGALWQNFEVVLNRGKQDLVHVFSMSFILLQ